MCYAIQKKVDNNGQSMLASKEKDHIVDFIQKWKDTSIFDYYKFTLSSGSQVSDEFIAETINNIKENYDNVDENRIYKCLGLKRFLYSANHCGFENYHHVLHSSILTQYTVNKFLDTDNVIFSCSSLTPVNPTSPCGLLSGPRNLNSDYKRFSTSFISRKYDSFFISKVPVITKESINNRLKFIDKTKLTLQDKLAINNLLEELPNLKNVSFIAQTSNYNTNKIANFLGKSVDNKTYFVDQDKLAIKLIINDLKKRHSPLRLLFTHKALLLKLLIALSNKNNTWQRELISINDHESSGFGTILFYYIKEKGSKVKLNLNVQGENLYLCAGNNINFEINPDVILQLLEEGKIVPNIYLTYMVFILLHKASIIGGIFFTNYIKDMLFITERVLGIKVPSYCQQNYMQSFMTPFKIISTSCKNTLNMARPMGFSDMIALGNISPEALDKVMFSKISESLSLSRFEAMLEGALTVTDIKEYEHELIQLLQDKCAFEAVFEQ